MPRVRSITQILIAAALLAACAPAAPVPTAVPPTVTVAPTLTLTVAPTATPTLTPNPTETPTPVPTQEDFSDIEYASSIDEAMEKKPVSRDDVLDGKLIRYAIENIPVDWPEGAEPVTWSSKDISGEGDIIFYPDQDDPSIQRVLVLRIDEGYGYQGRIIELYSFLQPDGTNGFYHLFRDLHAYDNDPRTLKTIKKEPYQLPVYKNRYQDQSIQVLTENAKLPDYSPSIQSLWYLDYYEEVQPLMNEWLETDMIPEDLSKIPLSSTSVSKY